MELAMGFQEAYQPGQDQPGKSLGLSLHHLTPPCQELKSQKTPAHEGFISRLQ